MQALSWDEARGAWYAISTHKGHFMFAVFLNVDVQKCFHTHRYTTSTSFRGKNDTFTWSRDVEASAPSSFDVLSASLMSQGQFVCVCFFLTDVLSELPK
jgi:hypothetical protein